jgi:hypothetical protein
MNGWKWSLLLGLLLFAVTFAGCSCGDDDDDSGGDGDDDDDDNDTSTDDDDDTSGITCYEDSDGDGFGNPESSELFPEECDEGWVDDNTDCDDVHEEAHPGGIDLPDDDIDGDCLNGDFEASDENGVFVSPGGSDADPGTMAAPKKTLQAGVDTAGAKGKSVFVAAGSYVNGVSTGVSMYGGYNSSFTLRDPDANLTMITGPAKASLTVAIGGNAVINGFTINGGLDAISSNCAWIGGSSTLIGNKLNGSTSTQSAFGAHIWGVSTIVSMIDNEIDGGDGSEKSTGVNIADNATVSLEKNLIYAGGGSNQSAGVKITTGTVTIADNEIDGGTGGNARGVYVDGGDVTLNRNEIIGGVGGSVMGLFVLDGNVTANDNQIDGGSHSKAKIAASYGAYLVGGQVTLTGNLIYGGSSYLTHGLFPNGAQVTANGNIIDGGESIDEGFGVYLRSETILVNNLILNSGCAKWCYTAYVNTDGSTLVNNTIVGGTLATTTWGLDIHSSEVAVVNNIIDPGEATGNSFGIRITTSPVGVALIGNDIWGQDMDLLCESDGAPLFSAVELNDCAFWPTNCAETSGNISADPEFANAASGDYHLTGNACVDTGSDPAGWYTGGLADSDFEGDPRPSGSGWDIGMDEQVPAK